MDVLDQHGSGETGKSLETVLNDGYQFDLGKYINEGFKLFGGDAGIYIAYTIVYFIIAGVTSSIPIVGWLASLFIGPPLLAGWYLYARNQKKGFSKSFGNFFEAFKIQWMQLVLQSLISAIFVGIAVSIVVLPFFISMIVDLIAHAKESQPVTDPEEMQELLLSMLTGKVILGIVLAALVGAMVSVLYVLAPMFIVFRGMGFWEAMEASRKVVTKNYGQFLLFMIILIVIGIVGFMMCCVGLLAAIPVIYLAIYSSFEDILGSGDEPIVVN